MSFDFPNAPTTGQVYNGYTWDGEKWLLSYNAPNTSGVVAIQVFTTNGSYVPSANMATCVIECYGAGGGGGGVAGAVSQTKVAGGAGSGGYSRKLATAAQIGVSQIVTIGAGGTGAAAGANGGGTGGVTSVGSLCIANGGFGGLPGAFSAGGNVGGAPGTGDFTARGQGGISAGGDTTAAMTIGNGGTGASSPVGSGGVSGLSNAGASPGNAATGYAAGGGGASAQNSAATAAGGAGAPGVVIITEYGMTALSSTTNAQGAVRFDVSQGLTPGQQTQACANINAMAANVAVVKSNYVINGGMQISQQNGPGVVTSNAGVGTSLADMFVYTGAGTSGQVSVANVLSATPGGSTSRARVTVTTATATVAVGDVIMISTSIEGIRSAGLFLGKPTAKTVTLSFGIKAPAGTYGVALRNGASPTRSYVAEVTVASGEANTDVVKTVTIPLDTAGTWLTDNGVGLIITWALIGGTNYRCTPGSWVTGNFMCGPNQSNFMGTVSNVIELFDVGLYEGTVAPPFQVPDYIKELQACMRYLEYVGAGVTGFSVAANTIVAGLVYKVQKRTNPTVTTIPNPGLYFPGSYNSAAGAVLAFQGANDTYGALVNVNGFTSLGNPLPFISNQSNWFRIDARI
jgi:hypothetical protein